MKLFSRLILFSLLLLGTKVAHASAGQAPETAPVIDAKQIEVSLTVDKPKIMLGEPTYFSFIVRNRSDRDLQVMVGGDYRNRLGRPESFTISVVSKTGQAVPQPDAGFQMGGLCGAQKIPAKGSYTFRLFLPHWATFDTVGSYLINAKRILTLRTYNAKGGDRAQTVNIEAQAGTAIEIVPADEEAMGKIIAELGETMLSDDYDRARAAAVSLGAIENDNRVIPYFVKSFEKKNYERKFTALVTLGKFNHELALETLKKGMETTGADLEGNNKEQAEQSAALIRHAAAGALADSPDPDAIPFLLTKRTDASDGVRLTIVHVLGKMDPKDGVPILREMAHDSSPMIRDEVKRYLDLMTPSKEKP